MEKNQAESPKRQLSSTTNRDDSEQVGGRHKEKNNQKKRSHCKKGLQGRFFTKIPQNSQTQHQQESQRHGSGPR